jgi:voltage-gated potassium channel Kch
MILLVGVTPALIVRTLASRPMINMTTVMGAADIYLLFGLFFSVVFTLVGAIIGHGTTSAEQAFFYSSRPLSPSDFIYYSYVTLTTVGYGDITAATSLGRMLSVTEALLGQLYLVTVVALLVGNFGRSRPTRSADGSGSAITADD